MSAANGPADRGGAGAKPGNSKDGFVAKAAGAVIASGIAWSIYKSFAPRNESAAYVNESTWSKADLKHEAEDLAATADREANKVTGKFQGKQNHKIIEGETLYTISRKYDVSVEALKDVNGLFGDQIVAGEKLIVPNK